MWILLIVYVVGMCVSAFVFVFGGGGLVSFLLGAGLAYRGERESVREETAKLLQ